MIQLKRAYDEPTSKDGTRVLVERLWPRGVTKERAALDLWLKDIAPSPALRKWYGHMPARWGEFEKRYWRELLDKPETVAKLRRLVRKGAVTFVYAAKDEERNGAVALKAFLERRQGYSRRSRQHK